MTTPLDIFGAVEPQPKVAQVSNLLYRRLPVGRLLDCLLGMRIGIRDTAGWKPALRDQPIALQNCVGNNTTFEQ